MIGVFVSVGVLGLLVLKGMRRQAASAKGEADERKRLDDLKARKRVTLDEAEDALVLGRRFKDGEAVRRFTPIVSELRKKRVSI